MNRYEFIRELKEALAGNVPSRVIAENEAFYQNYIEEELRKGRSETEIMEELGSPRLIANTIIDTTEPEEENYTDYTDYSEEDNKQQNTGLKLFRFSGWWLLLIPLLIVILVVSLVAHIISLLPGIVIWGIIGIFLYKWFRRR